MGFLIDPGPVTLLIARLGWQSWREVKLQNKSEKEEREFWQSHDSTEYVEYKSLENWRFPNLKLTTKPITLRLPAGLIDRVKIQAHKMDVPYQSLIKQYIFEGISKQSLASYTCLRDKFGVQSSHNSLWLCFQQTGDQVIVEYGRFRLNQTKNQLS